MNCTVMSFGLSFVSSKNTDLEIAEQFILMFTRCVLSTFVLFTFVWRLTGKLVNLCIHSLWGVLSFLPRLVLVQVGDWSTSVKDSSVRPGRKIRYQNLHFHYSGWRKQNFAFCHYLASILPSAFLVGLYAFLVGPAVRVFPALSLLSHTALIRDLFSRARLYGSYDNGSLG